MPLPKKVLDTVAEDIAKAEASFADLKEVVADMRLSGMDTKVQDAQVADLAAKIRSLKMFYDIRKDKT